MPIVRPMKWRACMVIPFLFVTLACDREEPAKLDQNPAPEKPTQSPPKAQPEQPSVTDSPELLSNKLGPFIACFTISRQLIGRHFQQADRRMMGKGKAVAAISEDVIARCETAVGEGRQLQPPLPKLEQALATYSEQSRNYWNVTQTLDAELQAKSRPKQAHKTQLEQAYGTWDNASLALEALLDEQQAEVDRRELATIESRSGKKIEYVVRARLIATRLMLACTTQIQVTAGSCQSAMDRLNAAQDAVEAYAKQHPDEIAAVTDLGSWLETAAKLRKDAQALLEALNGKKKNAKIGPLIEAFNASLTRGDALKFPEAGT